MEARHIPIIPNIKKKQQKKNNIFDGDKDPDVQHILKKKVEILDLETEPTEEELSSIKENKSSVSWIIIALVIVVILLLVAVTYFILTKNGKAIEEIPPDIIRPWTPSNNTNKHAPKNNNIVPQTTDKTIPQNNFIEPTEEELDNALERASDLKYNVSPGDVSPGDVSPGEDEYMDENIKNLIMEDEYDGDNMNYLNVGEIDEFHKQVIQEAN